MTPYRTLKYLLKRKRKFKKLIFPFSFFILEFSLIALLSLNILGFNLFNMSERYISKPIIYFKLIHPPEMINSAEIYSENIPYISLNMEISPIVVFFNIASIIIAFIGLIIAILWMDRFFKLNSLNIEWWIWPTGCTVAHSLFFFILL